MADDAVLNKAAVIERCLRRIAEEYEGNEDELENDFTRQDAIVLNLLRASEASIDLAMHATRVGKLGLPQSSRDAFALLEEAGWIEGDLSRRMQAMVGFRNVAVHDYQKLSLEIVKSILRNNLNDFRDFASTIVSRRDQVSWSKQGWSGHGFAEHSLDYFEKDPKGAMMEVGAYEAKANLSRLLERVEREGERITLTRYGRLVAILSPVEERREWDEVARDLREFRKGRRLGEYDLGRMVEEGRRFWVRSFLKAVARDGAVIHGVWGLEVANALVAEERRWLICPSDSSRFLALLRELPLEVEETRFAEPSEILALARDHDLSSHTASYLALARRQGLPLATLNEKLIEATALCGVRVFQP